MTPRRWNEVVAWCEGRDDLFTIIEDVLPPDEWPPSYIPARGGPVVGSGCGTCGYVIEEGHTREHLLRKGVNRGRVITVHDCDACEAVYGR